MKRTVNAFLLFIEAWFYLGVARLVIIFVPFRKIVRMLGRNLNADDNATYTTSVRPQRIRAAIRRASSFAPWRTRCFEQALAGKFMLYHRKMSSCVFFGVNKKEGDLNAHAWLESEGIIITGEQHIDQYNVIARFKS